MTSKCGKNKEVAHEPQASVSLMFLAHFDVQLCDLLLNGPMATKNLFVLHSDQIVKNTESSQVINRFFTGSFKGFFTGYFTGFCTGSDPVKNALFTGSQQFHTL